MINFLCNAFNDPSDPWYYVIGVLFLLAVFGAVAAYVIISGKRKSPEGKDEQDQASDSAEATDKDHATESTDEATEIQQQEE